MDEKTKIVEILTLEILKGIMIVFKNLSQGISCKMDYKNV